MEKLFWIFFSALIFCSSASAQTQVFSSSFVANSAGNAGLSYRQTVPAISTGGTTVSVSFNSTPGGVHSASHASVCVQASAFNCVAAPVELTFGGLSGFGIAASGASIDSDFVNLATAPGQTLIVIEDVTSANTPRNSAGPSGWDNYPSGGATWNLSTVGSGITYSSTYGFNRVRVSGGSGPPPPPPSTSLTAPGTPGNGRITLASGVAELYQDAVSSTIYVAPFKGNTEPVVDNSGNVQWLVFTSSDIDPVGLSLALDATWTAGSLYDLYVAYNGGVPAVCSAPAWSGSPLAPAVPDALYRGLKVNGAAISACRTGPTTSIACGLYQCKFKGTIKISSTAGSVRCDFSAGLNRECGVWNNDNQIDGVLKATDPTTVPYHFTTTFNNVNGSTPNTVVAPVAGNSGFSGTVVSGRATGRVHIDAALNHRGLRLNGEVNSTYSMGVGWNATNVFCGDTTTTGNYARDSLGVNATMNEEYYTSQQTVIAQTLNAWCEPLPFQGIGTAYQLEQQYWYSGEEWIDSGDVMLRVRFRY